MTKRGNGQGSIRQLPSKKWRYEIMLEGRRFSGTVASKTAAQQELAKLLTDAQRGGVVDPSTVTLGDYLTQWLDSKAGARAARTTAIQRGHLIRYIAPQIGEKRLQKLTPHDLRRLFDHLNAQGLGASSQRQVHQFLISALGEAQRLELLPRNVAQVVKPEPVRGKEERKFAAWTAEEAAQFVEVALQKPVGYFFVFALSTGMRRGEVAGLRWQDVDLERGTAQVSEVVAVNDNKVITTTPKTHGSRRTVYLSKSAVDLLRRQQQWQVEQREVFAQPVAGHSADYERKRQWVDSGRVFSNSFGATLDPHNLRREMLALCDKAQVKPITIHGLRHTYASLSLMRGVPAEVVSKQLGHSSVAFTLNQYRWVYQSERQNWALDLGQLTLGGK